MRPGVLGRFAGQHVEVEVRHARIDQPVTLRGDHSRRLNIVVGGIGNDGGARTKRGRRGRAVKRRHARDVRQRRVKVLDARGIGRTERRNERRQERAAEWRVAQRRRGRARARTQAPPRHDRFAHPSCGREARRYPSYRRGNRSGQRAWPGPCSRKFPGRDSRFDRATCWSNCGSVIAFRNCAGASPCPARPGLRALRYGGDLRGRGAQRLFLGDAQRHAIGISTDRDFVGSSSGVRVRALPIGEREEPGQGHRNATAFFIAPGGSYTLVGKTFQRRLLSGKTGKKKLFSEEKKAFRRRRDSLATTHGN